MRTILNNVKRQILNRLECGATKLELYELVGSYYKRLDSKERTELYELIDDIY